MLLAFDYWFVLSAGITVPKAHKCVDQVECPVHRCHAPFSSAPFHRLAAATWAILTYCQSDRGVVEKGEASK